MSRKKNLFTGCATALVTPFKDGEIDYIAFKELIEFQISHGADGIVILGTTGEASTVYEDERREAVSFAVSLAKGRIPVIVGTGSNATSVAVRYTKMAHELGADGCLVVTPYYNKSTTHGLIEHFTTVAKSADIPIILYNVPSRTAVSIPMEAYGALAKIDNIVGVKEASASLGYVTELIQKYGEYYDVYTGCDELILPTLALGGKGVISVIGNVVPSYVHQLCAEFFDKNYQKARELQLRLNPLIKEMFSEINPIPIKTALYKMGMCENEFRLPMCKSAREQEIINILKEYCLI